MEQGSKSDGEQQSKGGAREALRQVFSYYGVSLAQTFIEFGVFALLQALGVLSTLANALAVGVSATFNFLMNRNVTFRASSNFARSVVLFVLLYLWNFAFSRASGSSSRASTSSSARCALARNAGSGTRDVPELAKLGFMWQICLHLAHATCHYSENVTCLEAVRKMLGTSDLSICPRHEVRMGHEGASRAFI